MTEPTIAFVVASTAVVIASLAVSMAWNTLSYAKIVQRQHDRLWKEFWKQSHEQAAENGKQWGFQVRQAEWLRQQLEICRPATRKSTRQPPN